MLCIAVEEARFEPDLPKHQRLLAGRPIECVRLVLGTLFPHQEVAVAPLGGAHGDDSSLEVQTWDIVTSTAVSLSLGSNA